MRIFFVAVLVLNLLLEGAAGTALIFGPEGAFSDVRPEGGMWAMNYGFAALAIASAVFWIWPHRSDVKAVGAVLGILLTFHTLLSISLGIPGNQLGASITHGVMAVLCLILFTQQAKVVQPRDA